MIPSLILQQATRLGLSLIAVTDHNACLNAQAVIDASKGTGVHVLPGMEVQSKEEVHLLCLFDTVAQSLQWQGKVFERLPGFANKESTFGAQFVVNAAGEWVRTENRFLSGATDFGLEEVISGVHDLGGVVIPAHVDRPEFSLISNLGIIPESLAVEGLEVTRRFRPETGRMRWPQLAAWSLIVNGDAHRLQEIQNRTLFKIAAPRVSEIALALKGEAGRRVVVEWPAFDDEDPGG